MTDTAFAARHTMDSPEWYTPVCFVQAAREVMGGIDLDPASHEEANAVHQISRIFTAEDDGLSMIWNGRVFLNPPGGLVKEFWRHLIMEYLGGNVTQAIWIGYSLEQLQTLQQSGARLMPVDYPTCFTKQRIAFVENESAKVARKARCESKGKSFNPKSSPSHSNYISYLGPRIDDFRRVFSQFGVVR